MKKQFLPYYISRAILSAVFAIIVVGFNWKAILFTAVLFGFFLLYLHSGWFGVDSENPLFPLRRDTRGQLIQRKALIIAIVLGLVTFFSLSLLPNQSDLISISGNISIAMAIIAYFTSQFVLFRRT
jgi:hypothetical protein